MLLLDVDDATTDLELLLLDDDDDDVVGITAGCGVGGNFLSLFSSNCVFSLVVLLVLHPLFVVVDLGCCCVLSMSLFGAAKTATAAAAVVD